MSLGYFSETRQLLSAGEDGSIGVWDVAVDRKEVGPLSLAEPH